MLLAAALATFEFAMLPAWPFLAARPGDAALKPAEPGGGTASPVVITASLQPTSVLRSVTGEKLPEGAGLYSVKACSDATSDIAISGSRIEQALERRGISVTTHLLAQAAVRRSKGRNLSILARLGEAGAFVAPVIIGFAASRTINLAPWQVAAVSGAGEGLRIVSENTRAEREAVSQEISTYGAWLSDNSSFTLPPGGCTQRFLVMGSYTKGQPKTVTIGGANAQ